MRNEEMNMDGYKVCIEQTGTGFSAHSPDVEGCVVVGDTFGETRNRMREALPEFFAELRAEGLPVPEPSLPVVKRTGGVLAQVIAKVPGRQKVVRRTHGGERAAPVAKKIAERVIVPAPRRTK